MAGDAPGGLLGGLDVEDAGSAGEWLVAYRRRLDASEARWLDMLGRFDAEQRWAADGQLSCVEWLCARAGMGRPTAFDKVRVARQLRVRPVLARALAEGRVSYCALRALTRAEDTTIEVDEALVAVAEAGTVADVELVVRSYRLYQSQERPPAERGRPGRGVRLRRLGEGMTKLEAVLTDTEAAELDTVLRVLMDRSGHPEPGPSGHPEPGPHGAAGSGDASPQSSCEAQQYSCEYPSGAGSDQRSRKDSLPGGREREAWHTLRADALMDLVRCGLGEHANGADRHLVHFVVRDGQCSLLGGRAVPPEEMARLVCDCSQITHVETDTGAPLTLGRKQRAWSAAQRRAVTVRDGGRCRWPGCERTHVDIHHLLPWEDGGHTDVANAVALCPKHHTLIHAGFFAVGSADATVTFHRADGGAVGTSSVGP